MVREVREEVGLNVEFIKVIEVAEFVLDPSFHTQKHMVGLQSECKVVGDATPKIDNDEIQEAQYFSLDDAVKLDNLLDVTRKTIEKIISTNQ